MISLLITLNFQNYSGEICPPTSRKYIQVECLSGLVNLFYFPQMKAENFVDGRKAMNKINDRASLVTDCFDLLHMHKPYFQSSAFLSERMCRTLNSSLRLSRERSLFASILSTLLVLLLSI